MPTSEEIDARAKLLAMGDGYGEEEWGAVDEPVRTAYKMAVADMQRRADDLCRELYDIRSDPGTMVEFAIREISRRGNS